MFSFRGAGSSRQRRKYLRPTLSLNVEAVEPRLLLTASPTDVLTWRNDNGRTGQDLFESQLTPQNVNVSTFGKLFTDNVDGKVYAQTLYKSGVAIPGQGTHNVTYVATEHDSVYAFDADTGTPLWHTSFIDPAAGITTVPTSAVWQQDLSPEVGITSTPVIDAGTNTMYVVAETQVTSGGRTSDVLQLHAIDITTGAEKDGGPVTITATVKGRGIGRARNGTVTFNPNYEIQRPGLLLSDGVVYAAFGSLGDFGPYHGWVMGFDAQTLQKRAVFNDSPNANDRTHNQGGIWMGGAGLASDSTGSVYAATGSGPFSVAQRSYADSDLKLSPGLKLTDYFTPTNQKHLDKVDSDLGSGGVLIVPDQPGPVPHLLIGGGKDGTIFVVNRDKMGHFNARKTAAHQDVQIGDPIFSTPAYFNGTIYYHPVGGVLTAYKIVNGSLVGPVSQSSTSFGYPGANPSISASGNTNGIVWEIQNTGHRNVAGAAVLHAYDANDVSHELYNSAQDAARDGLGTYVKFTVPTIANGKVYVGTQSEVSVFGLLPSA